MKILIGIVLLCAGYIAGAFLGGALVELLSGNRHDRGMEAAMTGAFVTGPLFAILFVLVGWLWSKRRTG